MAIPDKMREDVFSSGGPDDATSSLTTWWKAILRRKLLLASITLAGVLGGLLITYLETPVYRSRASLEVENMPADVQGFRDGPGSPSPTNYESYLQTQIELLQSRAFFERVSDRLHLADYPGFQQHKGRMSQFLTGMKLIPPAKTSPSQAVYENLYRDVSIRQTRQSNIVELQCVSNDPQLAARIVNTLATEFVQSHVESRGASNQRTSGWLERQLAGLKQSMERSEAELLAYGANANLLYTNQNESVAEQKLAQLQSELTKAQADRIAKEPEEELIKAGGDGKTRPVLESGPIREYQTKLADLQRQRSQFDLYLTAKNRKVEEVDAQIAFLLSKIAREQETIAAKVHQDFDAAQRRERILQEAYNQQRKLVMADGNRSIRYNTLKHEAETNRTLYETVFRRLHEAGISSALRANNVRIVDLASPEGAPIRPVPLFNAALGLTSGMLLGLFCVFLRERSDQTLQNPGSTALFLNLPELGVIPSSRANLGLVASKRHSLPLNSVAEDERAEKQSAWNLKDTPMANAFRATAASILLPIPAPIA